MPRKSLNYTASFWPRNNHILSLKCIALNIREVREHVRERDGLLRQQENEIGVRDREGNENEGDNVAVCIPVLLLETVKLLKVHLR